MKPPARTPRPFGLLLLLCQLSALWGCNAERQSLDLTVADAGLGFGNSARIHGLRFNVRDDQVEAVNGLNVTLWDPGENPEMVHRGLAVGLARTDARDMTGISVGSVAGAHNADGLNVGLLAVFGEGVVRGINLGPFLVWGGEQLTGLNAGLMVAGGGGILGLNLAALTITPRPVTDLFGEPDGSLSGLNAAGLIIDYPHLNGVSLAGLVRSRQLTGLTAAYVLADAREAVTGLSVAPFNFTDRLQGVQLGLLNHVASHPHPFKWLPLINVGWSRQETEERHP